MKNYELTLRY